MAFADEGDLGNGNKNCTSNCFVATQPTDESKTTESGDSKESNDSILITVQEYLDSFFKYFEN